jgi:hypothetical protein
MAHYAKPAENPDPKSVYAFVLRAFEIIESAEEGNDRCPISTPKAVENFQRLISSEAEDVRYVRAQLGRAYIDRMGLSSSLAGAPTAAVDHLRQVVGDTMLGALRSGGTSQHSRRIGEILPRLSARVLAALQILAAGSELRALIVAMNSTDPASGRLRLAKLVSSTSAHSVAGGSAGLGGDLSYNSFRSARMTMRRFQDSSQVRALRLALSCLRDDMRLRAILFLFASAAERPELRPLTGNNLAEVMHEQFYLPWLVRAAIDRTNRAQTHALGAA